MAFLNLSLVPHLDREEAKVVPAELRELQGLKGPCIEMLCKAGIAGRLLRRRMAGTLVFERVAEEVDRRVCASVCLYM